MIRKAMTAVLMLACAVALVATTNGCKRKPGTKGAGAGLGPDSDRLSLTDISSMSPLPERSELSGSLVAGQMFEPVLFAYDSAQIDPAEQSKLDRVAQHLRSNPQANLVIEGHCDERGSAEYNMALGERRALATRAYLIGAGIDGSRLQTKSFGEEQPVDPGHSEDAWRKNRRAEFRLFQ